MADKAAGRVPMREQAPSERIHNFEEAPFGYSPEEAMAEAARCLLCKNPHCVSGCPVEIDIPAFVRLIAEGKFLEAVYKIKEKNALPAICGRVCPQEEQCEAQCILAKKGAPISIGALERFAADFEAAQGDPRLPELPPKNGRKVAVVGSGPAGLTVCVDLAMLGYDVTLFEAFHQAGGVLLYGIPEFRLPKRIVARELDYISRLGVRIECNTVVGKTVTVDELLGAEGFDAVFIGSGAGLPMFMGLPGEDLKGVYSANEYLTRSNLMKAYLFPQYDTPMLRGQRVAVFGGGNVALDAARTALRLGPEKVYLIYRRSRAEMPAREAEIHHAEQEGIDFRYLTNPVRYLGDEQGRLRAIECVRMELGEPDASGRRRPVVIPDSNFTLDVDIAIVAIGARANPLLLKTVPDLKLDKRGYIEADPETGRTSKRGVFAGGDIVTGAATVILAMGAGRKAARAIHQYLEWKYW